MTIHLCRYIQKNKIDLKDDIWLTADLLFRVYLWGHGSFFHQISELYVLFAVNSCFVPCVQ